MKQTFLHLEHWISSLSKYPAALGLSVPVDVAIREAVKVSSSFKKRWSPIGKIPGLYSMPELSSEMGDELLSIVRAVYEAQLLYYLEEESDPGEPDEGPHDKTRRLLGAMRPALEYLEDMLPSKQQAQLTKIKEIPEQKRNDDGSLYLMLRLYWEVSNAVQDKLALLGESFDMSLIQEAKEHLALLERMIQVGTPAPNKEARDRYYRVLGLMTERVGKIRAAAGYLYREHKTVLKEFTSSYERNRRRKSKKQGAKKTKE